MKITFLILHIICAILSGVLAVATTSMASAIIWEISAICWSILIGADIVEITEDNERNNHEDI